MNSGPDSIKWFQLFLEDREQCVYVDGTFSDFFFFYI